MRSVTRTLPRDAEMVGKFQEVVMGLEESVWQRGLSPMACCEQDAIAQKEWVRRRWLGVLLQGSLSPP
jgi:hypothetical protein